VVFKIEKVTIIPGDNKLSHNEQQKLNKEREKVAKED
jgi:hypothetical protein